MALAGVLSALRELILDGVDLPKSEAERLQEYGKRFPSLSDEERTDLARIAPNRIALYTSSVFAGEASIIKGNFLFTCALLERALVAAGESGLDLTEMMKRIHQFEVWKSIDSESLAKIFVKYISTQMPNILASEPWLPDAARFELAAMDVRKAPTGMFSAKDSIDVQEFSSLTVDRLLEVPLFVPANVRVVQCAYDIRSARQSFFDSKKEHLAEVISERDCIFVGGRPKDYGSSWMEIGPNLATELARQSKSNSPVYTGKISDLAEPFVSDLSNDTPEAEQFVKFLTALNEMIQAGIVVVDKV